VRSKAVYVQPDYRILFTLQNGFKTHMPLPLLHSK
jgi:hypothetical protein